MLERVIIYNPMYERCSVHELYYQKGRLSQFLYEGINKKKGSKGENIKQNQLGKGMGFEGKGKRRNGKGMGKC